MLLFSTYISAATIRYYSSIYNIDKTKNVKHYLETSQYTYTSIIEDTAYCSNILEEISTITPIDSLIDSNEIVLVGVIENNDRRDTMVFSLNEHFIFKYNQKYYKSSAYLLHMIFAYNPTVVELYYKGR
jgi:hypothetical protein